MRRYIEYLILHFAKYINFSEDCLSDSLNPIELFTSSIDMRINIFNITSIAILIGLFINFISGISICFPVGNHDILYPLIYLIGLSTNIFIFFLIMRKYLLFINSWMNMQDKYKNDKTNIINLLNKAEELISWHCYDNKRYILIIFYILITINISLPVKLITNIIHLNFFLLFPSLIVFLFIFILIEWPTILLHQFNKNFIKQKVDRQEKMSFD